CSGAPPVKPVSSASSRAAHAAGSSSGSIIPAGSSSMISPAPCLYCRTSGTRRSDVSASTTAKPRDSRTKYSSTTVPSESCTRSARKRKNFVLIRYSEAKTSHFCRPRRFIATGIPRRCAEENHSHRHTTSTQGRPDDRQDTHRAALRHHVRNALERRDVFPARIARPDHGAAHRARLLRSVSGRGRRRTARDVGGLGRARLPRGGGLG